MNFLHITLDSLLKNPNIYNVFVNDIWYFEYSDINEVYEDNFKFTPTKKIRLLDDNKNTLKTFISFPEIQDHINYNKTKPSFENYIDIIIGINTNQ